VIVDYKDDATAFNGLKKGTIAGKGVVNNKVSNHFFRLLESKGIPTHFVEQLSDRETAVKRVEIRPSRSSSETVPPAAFPSAWACRKGPNWPASFWNTAIKTTRSATRSSTPTTSAR
jgi:phosphoribosylaminoimidazole-succinocarboxamide synthase